MMEHTPETVATKNNANTKWGVRIVAFYFFARAVFTVLELIQNPSDAGGFFGVGGESSYVLPLIGSGTMDLLAVVEVCALILIGYLLSSFNSGARAIALFLLWPSLIVTGLLLVFSALSAIYSLFGEAKLSATWNLFYSDWPGKITNPILFVLGYVVVFFWYFGPTYILMRKDVKQLFQKPAPTGETN